MTTHTSGGSSAKLVTITPDAEKTMGYIARVSNPANQENEDVSRLLAYCLKSGHWSVFEAAYLTIEVETSLAVATQILRHRSFTFQQFSQRYQDVNEIGDLFIPVELRRQDEKNRQSSHDDISVIDKEYFYDLIDTVMDMTRSVYEEMLEFGVAKECARMILPQCTRTRMYVTGNVRSWITYLQTRTHESTQKEHRDVALACRDIFVQELPIVSKALGW